MRSVSFLISRRWILFAVAIGLTAWACWWLGGWQFDRLEERKDRNEIIDRNVDARPVAVGDVLAVGQDVTDDDQWRRITATGEYDVANTVVVRYRTREGASGVDVLVPLVTSDGTALLVDRGWLATENRGTTPDEVPDPPSGQVTITGWVRQDATGDSTKVTEFSTRAISSEEISDSLGITTYGGFIDLESEDPAPEDSLERVELPDTGTGPHFFYGLQWWFFGVLAIFGFGYLAYDEWRGPRSKSAEHAAVDGEHDPGDEG